MREWQVRDWVQSSLDGSGMHETINTKAVPNRMRRYTPANDARKTFVLNFFKNLSTLPSHYCRATIIKSDLEPPIMSMMDLYRLYVESFKASSAELEPPSRTIVAAQFETLNLSIYRPKKKKVTHARHTN